VIVAVNIIANNDLHMNSVGNKKIRHEHITKVLNFIRLAGEISRVDIGNALNLSKPTVTRVINDLMQAGLVCECGQLDSKVGRKKTLVKIVPDSRFVISLNLSKNNVNASIIDITMKSRGSAVHSLKNIKTNDEVYNLLISVVEELIENNNIPKERIWGIGVGVPGLVDYKSGVVWKLDIKNPLTNVHVKDILEQHFKLPTLVDNNVNTLALGEYWFGCGRDKNVQELVYIFCSEGVGGGIITSGNLLRGKDNIAAEIGEMIINIEDNATRGRLEDYCSTDVVEAVTNLDFEEACKRALKGDKQCRDAIERAIKALGVGIVNITSILNPEIIVVSGKFVDAYPPFLSEAEKYARSRMASDLAQKVQIIKRKNRDAPYEIGAAALIFKIFFND